MSESRKAPLSRRQARSLHRAIATALALAAGTTAAQACVNGVSYTGGVRTPAFDWFCQTHTGNDTIVNDALDDWGERVVYDPPLMGVDDPVLPAGNAPRAPSVTNLTELRRNYETLLARKQELEINIRERREWVEAFRDAVRWIGVLGNALRQLDPGSWEAQGIRTEIINILADYGFTQAPTPFQIRTRNGSGNLVEEFDKLWNELEPRLTEDDHLITKWEAEAATVETALNETIGALASAFATANLAPMANGIVVTSQMNGPAPLAWNWWSTGSLDHNDEAGGARLTETTTASFMTGLSTSPTPETNLSLGIGYARTHTEERDLFGGGTLTGNAFKSVLTGTVTPGMGLTFDATGSFDYSWNHRVRTATGTTDDFTMHVIGFGAGINGVVPVQPGLAFDWRLGYAGTWTMRHASVDSAGTPQGRSVMELHRLSGAGQLAYALPDGAGELFATAKLNAIVADTSIANRSAQPFDLEIGAGGAFDLGGIDLEISANYGGIGRAGQTTYGASATLTFPF